MGCKFQQCEKYGPNCFEMVMANGERRYMQAVSKEERDDWIRVLSESAQKSAKCCELGEKLQGGVSRKLTPDDFNFVKVLGKGNYGKVMLATLKGEENSNNCVKYYAVKVIKKSGLIDDESLEHVLSENRVLQNMSHPYLVKLFYSFQTRVQIAFNAKGSLVLCHGIHQGR